MNNGECYLKKINHVGDTGMIDIYSVLVAYNVTNPAIAHAIKKLLCAGQRGVKDNINDLNEAVTSIERAIEIELIIK